MSVFSEKTLVFAIGNASRGDDGLGWAFAEALELAGIFPGEIAMRYQLQIEDAELCAQYDTVIFVDAWKSDESEVVAFVPCTPTSDVSFTTHALSPQAVLFLCHSIFDKYPESWLLLLRGTQWGLGEELSAIGKRALQEGISRFMDWGTP